MLGFLHKKELCSLKVILKIIFFDVAFLVFFPVLFSCGLETVTHLNPPTPEIKNDPYSPLFSFLSTEKNSEIEFRGYDLYYKFIIDDPTGSDINYSTEEELTQNGFYRVTGIKDASNTISDSRPLIDIPAGRRGDDFTVIIDFTDLIDSTNTDNPKVYSDPSDVFSEIQIFRGIKDSDLGQYKSFLSIAIDDSDIGSEIYQSLVNHSSLNVLMYAISYGGIFSNIYKSDAVYLGYITINNAYNFLE